MSLDNDIAFQEWKTCRETLRELDKILVDLRKYGFGLITILLSADGFLFTQTAISDVTVFGIFVALIVLIAGLFRFDRVHEVFIRAAVLRAMKLEKAMSPPMAMTWEIACWSNKLRTGTWGHYLYVLFCFAAYALAIAGLLHAKDATGISEKLLVGLCAVVGFAASAYVLCHHGQSAELQKTFDDSVKEYSAAHGYQAPAESSEDSVTVAIVFLLVLFGGSCAFVLLRAG